MKKKLLYILKKIYKKVLYGYKSSSNSYIKYLQSKGVSIGKNVTFHEPNTNYIDTQRGFLIKIGNNVEITRNVIILTHDYSWAVNKVMTGKIIGSRDEIDIGDNVFIGMNTIILKGVKIGDNVIIGANSTITRSIPSNSIVCGTPGKVIGSVDDYFSKREEKTIIEAINLFISYYNKYHSIPDKSIFDEFFWIFESRENNLIFEFDEKLRLCGNYEFSKNRFLNSAPIFNGYNSFCDYCLEKISDNDWNKH